MFDLYDLLGILIVIGGMMWGLSKLKQKNKSSKE